MKVYEYAIKREDGSVPPYKPLIEATKPELEYMDRTPIVSSEPGGETVEQFRAQLAIFLLARVNGWLS